MFEVDKIRENAEIELQLLDKLWLDYNGNKIMYKKGLLSGWRITSLLGTMVSQAVCQWLETDLGLEAAERVSQGDDIIIGVNQFVKSQQVEDSLAKISLRTGGDRSVFSFGEFLRKYYFQECILGIPSRVVRSLFFANPWLEQGQFKGVNEIALTWHQFRSRFTVLFGHSQRIYNHMVTDIARFASASPKHIRELLGMPMSMKGLGMLEDYVPNVGKILDFVPKSLSLVKKYKSTLSFLGLGIDMRNSY